LRENYHRDSFISDLSSKEIKHKYNIALLGEGAVGKSAITIRFIKNVFIKEYNSTIEEQYPKNRICINHEAFELNILDTAGMEDLRKASDDTMIRKRDGYILVFDVTNRESFERIAYFRDVIRKYYSDTAPVLVVGNKVDEESRRMVSKDEAMK